MGLTEVRQAITKNAEAEAEAILITARAEAATILRNAKERIAAERAAFDAETEHLLDIHDRRELSSASAQSKAIILDAKRKTVNDAFTTASSTLAGMNGSERTAIISQLSARAGDELTVARVRAASADVQALGKVFPNASILADQTMRGGFIATNADGTIAIDLTFETLLVDVHDKELLPVSEILFSTRTTSGDTGSATTKGVEKKTRRTA